MAQLYEEKIHKVFVYSRQPLFVVSLRGLDLAEIVEGRRSLRHSVSSHLKDVILVGYQWNII